MCLPALLYAKYIALARLPLIGINIIFGLEPFMTIFMDIKVYL